MAFKMTPKSALFGLHDATSSFGTPVIKKNDLDPGIEAEANRDGTIFVSDKLPESKIQKAVEHEKVHLDQMNRGDLDYNDSHVFWKGKKYPRATMKEGSKKLPWEAEAYAKQ